MKNASRRLLPPMATLHCFEAAARLGSFSRAGQEIGLTQGAVSRQIALLEDWLQVRLFDRAGRRVALNTDGDAYAQEIAPALERIRRATARMIDRPQPNELNVATLPSFGMRWLAPRLSGLTARHPDLIVSFAARSVPFDLARDHFDAAVHFGLPDWPDAEHDLLFRETAIPVCAPSLLAGRRMASPADLIGLPLLALHTRANAWERWFAQAGVPFTGGQPLPKFDQFLMLAQAAAAGAGLALLPSFLIGPELESGALVNPWPEPLVGEEAYYLVYPKVQRERPAFARFRDWLLEEAASVTSACAPIRQPVSAGQTSGGHP
jgi:LysR family glycine cleavage system transcriptional activator